MNVAVIGAGIAGLRTAQLLEREGIDVTVFEASNRIGGRMLTVEVGGQEFEAGAEWIDREHVRVFVLLSELGMQAVQADTRPRKHFFGGRFIEKPSVDVSTHVSAQSLSEALDASVSNSIERQYLEAVALSDEGTDSDQVDFEEWKRFTSNYSERNDETDGMSAFRFPVSASALCEKVASTIRGDIVTGMELAAVRDYFGAQLRFLGGTKETFDYAVVTVPPSCLNRINYDGEKFWDGVEMTPTCKVALLFSEPLWEREGWSGMLTDLAVQQVWPCGNALVCYVNGRGVQRLFENGDPVREALESLGRVLPRAHSYFVEGRVVDWRREHYAGGGFPFVSVGSRRQAPPNSGPVRFAGDWTAQWMGFVEGALESAERVVAEIKYEQGVS